MALGKVNENIFSVNHYNKIFKDINQLISIFVMTEWKLFRWGSTRQYILISKEKGLMQIKLIWNIRDGKKL